LNRSGNLPAQNFRPTGKIIGSSTAQTTARGQKRHRLKHIGLSRAIRANQGNRPAIKHKPRGPVTAKMRQGEGFDHQTAHGISLSVRVLVAGQTRIGMTT
jgi:hypothetical protein